MSNKRYFNGAKVESDDLHPNELKQYGNHTANQVLNYYRDRSTSQQEFLEYFPPPPKGRGADYCINNEQRLTYKGDRYVLKQDSRLMDMIFSDEPRITLEAQMQVCSHPIVGLEFVTEYINPNAELPRVYDCSLCKTLRSVQSIMEHLISYNHQVNYIKHLSPKEGENYECDQNALDFKHSRFTKNRNKDLIKIALKRCRELELVYGRGQYKVSYDKPQFTDEVSKYAEIDLQDGEEMAFLRNLHQSLNDMKIDDEEMSRLLKAIVGFCTNAICEFKFSK